jgi:hypothetical protein
MYAYAFTKPSTKGTASDRAVQADQQPRRERSERSVQTVILGDLGRADVQAMILRRLDAPIEPYDLRDGETYVGDVVSLVPRIFGVDKTGIGKREAGTELLYGRQIVRDGFLVGYIYGLGGEWMLNFPELTVPVAFFLFALACVLAFRFVDRLSIDDVRRTLIPVVSVLVVIGLGSDFDNTLDAALRYGAVPFLVLLFGSRRASARAATP